MLTVGQVLLLALTSSVGENLRVNLGRLGASWRVGSVWFQASDSPLAHQMTVACTRRKATLLDHLMSATGGEGLLFLNCFSQPAVASL